MRIRPLLAEDAAAVVRLMWAALPPVRPDVTDAHLVRRLAFYLEHDPGGAWLAEDDGGLAGIATAVRREGIWVLSWLGVHPGARARGVGGRLLTAALGHGDGCRGFLVAASDDPRAMRLYARAGFAARPSLRATGRPRSERAPGLDAVREGGTEDLERCVEVDRRVRGGGRRRDLEYLLAEGASLFVAAGGFAVGRAGSPLTLAALNADDAALLLWRVLADAGEESVDVDWMTADQDWAVRTVLEAGLALDRGYAYFTRGELGPLAPWLPNNALL